MLEVTVDRKRWIRGGYAGTTAAETTPEHGGVAGLLTRPAKNPEDEDMHCCMGFAALAAGIPYEQTVNVATVNGLAAREGVEVPAALKAFVSGAPGTCESTGAAWDIPRRAKKVYGLNDSLLRSALGDSEAAKEAPKTEADREERLRTAGRTLGVNFRFVN